MTWAALMSPASSRLAAVVSLLTTRTMTVLGSPAVAVGPTLIRVFVRTPTGEIATQQQNVGGTWPATWTTIAGAAAGGPPTAVTHPTNGTYQVFTRTTDGRFQWASELTRNSGTWTTWATFETPDSTPLISDPTAFTWTGNAQKFGIVYRIGNDINQIANFTTTTPPPTATATTKSATRSKAPQFSTYSK